MLQQHTDWPWFFVTARSLIVLLFVSRKFCLLNLDRLVCFLWDLWVKSSSDNLKMFGAVPFLICSDSTVKFLHKNWALHPRNGLAHPFFFSNLAVALSSARIKFLLENWAFRLPNGSVYSVSACFAVYFVFRERCTEGLEYFWCRIFHHTWDAYQMTRLVLENFKRSDH